jgi:Putative adhesin
MRTPTRLLLGGALFFATAGVAFGAVNYGLDDTQVNTYAMSGLIREVVVKSDSGSVDLVPGTAGVQVRETQHFVSMKPSLHRTVEAGVLTLDSHCTSVVLRCYADLRVRVPAGVKVSVDADSGDVRAGWVDVREMRVRGDSGDIDLRLAGRQSRVYAHTDSGDVTTTVRARSVDARTDSGDVSVYVPRGDYAVDADTDSGDVDVAGISRNDHATKSITARTDSGDVTVRAR